MRKRTLPLLISTMLLALIGIIVIQYMWIKKSVSEKQDLINQKVHQAIANLDQHLTDFNMLTFLSLNDTVNFNYTCDTLSPLSGKRITTVLLHPVM